MCGRRALCGDGRRVARWPGMHDDRSMADEQNDLPNDLLSQGG